MSEHTIELRVWWIPQVPMSPFFYPVPSIEAGDALLDALAKYDMFQFENNVKPDYCNAGGMEWKHPTLTDGEWESCDQTDEWERQRIAELAPSIMEEVKSVLGALLGRDQANTCRHETTKRGGAIWEICDECGQAWADDKGGKPDWKDPAEWDAARALLAKLEGR